MYGKEVGDSGTPHLQGFICHKQPKSLKQVIKAIPGAHIEVMLGRVDHNVTYCGKDGDTVILGTIPKTNKEKGKKEKERWRRINLLVEDGDWETLREEFPGEWNRRHFHFKRLHLEMAPPPCSTPHLNHRWYYGETGTGKSRSAREEFPDAYIKLNNKWWDGYSGEPVVILDDLDKYDVALGGHLKRWSDHHPFPAEYKGGVKTIRPETIIVTSNYTPEEIWDDEKTLGPLNRRFTKTQFRTIKLKKKRKRKEKPEAKALPHGSWAAGFTPAEESKE